VNVTPWYRRWAWVCFALFFALVFLFGVLPGPWFEEDSLARDDNLLLSAYAAGTAVFGLAITLTAFRRGERWAWFAFWFWPLFFVFHGVAFFFVDFIFAALAVAALLLTRPAKLPS
jgi:hypothetical protein